jgi:hypothetical protein
MYCHRCLGSRDPRVILFLVRSPADGPPSTLSAAILPGARQRRQHPSSAPAGRSTTLEAAPGELSHIRSHEAGSVSSVLRICSVTRSAPPRLHPPVPSLPTPSPPSPRPVQEPRSAAASPPACRSTMAAAFGECGTGGEGGSAGGGSGGSGEGGSANGWSRGAGGGEGGSPLPSPCVAAHAHLDGGVPTVVGRVQHLLQRGATALEWCCGPAPAADAGEGTALGAGQRGGGGRHSRVEKRNEPVFYVTYPTTPRLGL